MNAKPTKDIVELQRGIYHQTRYASQPAGQVMPWLFDPRNLEAAWERVRRSDGANTPGVDGRTCSDLDGKFAPFLTALADELYHQRYQPSPPRRIGLPKTDGSGGTREIGILTVRDRVVCAALKQVLEPLFEPGFDPRSFGFRPGRCVAGALAEATRLLSSGRNGSLPYATAVRMDVADCFATIDHERLMASIAERVADAELLRLLEKLLAAGGQPRGRFWNRRNRGVVQGSALSPLLCNIYLSALDRAVGELGEVTRGAVRMLRYADDLLMLAGAPRQARAGVACVRAVLRSLRQRCRQRKSARYDVRRGVDWLGVTIRPRPQRWRGHVEFGYVIPDGAVLRMFDRVAEMTAAPSTHIDRGAFNLSRWIVSLNDKLREWRQAYVYADNAPEVFAALDEHTAARVEQLLTNVTGLRREALHRKHRVRLPRGFRSWEVDGARLVILSSLAPRCADLTRRPLWMRRAVQTNDAVEAK